MSRSTMLSLLLLCACTSPQEALNTAAPAELSIDPVLSVTTPEAAAWLRTGPMAVSGYVRDAHSVTFSGSPLSLAADESFQVDTILQRGINLIELTADGDDGTTLTERRGVIAGSFADPRDPVSDGLLLRLNQPGLDTFGALAAAQLTADALAPSLDMANPVYSTDPFVGTELKADLAEVGFSTAAISATPTPGALELDVVLPDLVVDVDVYGEITWIDFSASVQMTADRATITTEVTLGVDPDGMLTVSLLDPEVALEGFRYDASILPSWIEDYLFTESIQSSIEDALIAQLQTMVPELLDETLSTIERDFALDLLGREATLELGFDSVDVDAEGVEMGVILDISMDGDGSKTYAGYLASEGPAPRPDTAAPLAIRLADDLANQLMFELWRGGAADLALSTEDGTLDASLFEDFPLPSVTLQTRAALPPVLTGAGERLAFQLAELELTADTPGSTLGEHLVAKLDLMGTLSLGVEDSRIVMTLDTLVLGLHIVESDWKMSPSALQNLISSFVSPEAVQSVLDELDLVLPELYGMSLSEANVVRDSDGYHTTITAQVDLAE